MNYIELKSILKDEKIAAVLAKQSANLTQTVNWLLVGNICTSQITSTGQTIFLQYSTSSC